MKIIPIVLTGLSLMVHSFVLAEKNFSADSNLEIINSKLIERKSILNEECQYPVNKVDVKKQKLFSSAHFASENNTSTNRIVTRSSQSKEIARLNDKSITPGINIFNIRVSKTKSLLSSKFYANTNRYVNRAALPMRMNLLVDAQAEPVYPAIMFTRSGENIAFKPLLSKTIHSNKTNLPASLNHRDANNLIDSLIELENLNLQDKQINNFDFALNAEKNTTMFCTISASIN